MTELKYEFKILENEYWWGGSIDKGTDNPFSSTSVYEEDLSITGGNQTMPLYISSKGRYIHCDNLYRVKIENGKILFDSEVDISEKSDNQSENSEKLSKFETLAL